MLATARNIARKSTMALDHMCTTGNLFKRYGVFVYENDSNDGTQDALIAWAQQDGRRHARCELLGRPRWGHVASSVRGDHMAEYREKMRAMAGDGWDYYVVVDPDIQGWSLEGVLHSVGLDEWDALAGNGLTGAAPNYRQYDTWALRGKDWEQMEIKTPRRGEPLIPVWSAFGGIAIYRRDAWEASCYSGGTCEHVGLYQSMRLAGYDRVFINPSLIACY